MHSVAHECSKFKPFARARYGGTGAISGAAYVIPGVMSGDSGRLPEAFAVSGVLPAPAAWYHLEWPEKKVRKSNCRRCQHH